jgi:hypothetical protein
MRWRAEFRAKNPSTGEHVTVANNTPAAMIAKPGNVLRSGLSQSQTTETKLLLFFLQHNAESRVAARIYKLILARTSPAPSTLPAVAINT